MRGEPGGGEGPVPAGRADPGADAGEDALAEGAGVGVDAELRGVEHVAGVAEEGGPVLGEGGGEDAEEGGHALAFGVELLAGGGGERGKGELVGEQGAFDEGGVDPEEGVEVVGLVVLALGMEADGLGKLAADGGVAAVEAAGGRRAPGRGCRRAWCR